THPWSGTGGPHHPEPPSAARTHRRHHEPAGSDHPAKKKSCTARPTQRSDSHQENRTARPTAPKHHYEQPPQPRQVLLGRCPPPRRPSAQPPESFAYTYVYPLSSFCCWFRPRTPGRDRSYAQIAFERPDQIRTEGTRTRNVHLDPFNRSASVYCRLIAA